MNPLTRTVVEARTVPAGEVVKGVHRIRSVFVNLYLIEDHDGWVLVDAGVAGATEVIIKEAEKLFGKGTTPQAIILTHGHFDHVGSLEELLEHWQVPVYAHYMELPYLTGRSPYPPADPTVGGGGMAWSSFVFPNDPIDLGDAVQPLPDNGSIPGLPSWHWIYTPGHAPGHISLFRDEDRTLIAGDAFVTTNQASVYAVATQKKEMHGPPPYFTPDWLQARESVRKLAQLDSEAAATGHGEPMYSEELRDNLHLLFRRFQERAVPVTGRYVRVPALFDEEGLVYTPPYRPQLPVIEILIGAGIAAAAAFTAVLLSRRNRD